MMERFKFLIKQINKNSKKKTMIKWLNKTISVNEVSLCMKTKKIVEAQKREIQV